MVIVSQWSQNTAHTGLKDSRNRRLAHRAYAKLHPCDCTCSDGPLLCSGLHVRSTYLASKAKPKHAYDRSLCGPAASRPQLLRTQAARDDTGPATTCLSREHLRTY
eukprot:UN5002